AEQVRQQAGKWAQHAAMTVGEKTKSLKEKTKSLKAAAVSWEPLLRRPVEWLGDRRCGIGLVMMIVGSLEFLWSLTWLEFAHRDYAWLFLIVGCLIGATVFQFGRQLQRGRMTPALRWAGCGGLIPWMPSGLLIVPRLLLTLLGLVSSLSQRPESDADTDVRGPAPDVVDAVFSFLRRARTAVSPRVMLFSVAGVIGWLATAFSVAAAVYVLWFAQEAPSQYVVIDNSATLFYPAGNPTYQAGIRAGDTQDWRGTDMRTLNPRRTHLELSASSPVGNATLEVDFEAHRAKLRTAAYRSGERTFTNLPVDRATVEQWMSAVAADPDAETTQQEISHLTDVIGVMMRSRGILHWAGTGHADNTYPTAEPQILKILADEKLRSQGLIPVGRLLDPRLFRNESTGEDIIVSLRPNVLPVYSLLLIGGFVFLTGLARTIRVLYRHLWCPEMENRERELVQPSSATGGSEPTSESQPAPERERASATVSERKHDWTICCVMLMLTAFCGTLLIVVLSSAAGLLHLRHAVLLKDLDVSV
ncbi:MAG: hypothetical protein KDA89_18900, partial [Planctomycetaceae bacterium]|nr:hypothetical protein [Planctomycetaceae bacterium]